MRIYAYLLISLSLLSIVLAGCNPSSKTKDEYYSSIKSTSLESENIKSLSIGDSRYEAADAFKKKPDFIEIVEKPSYMTYVYGKSKEHYDVEFRIERNEISRYDLLSNKYHTEKGIHTGENKKDVIMAYGKNYYERKEDGAKIMGYADKPHKLTIEFALDKNNKVVGIMVGKIKDKP